VHNAYDVTVTRIQRKQSGTRMVRIASFADDHVRAVQDSSETRVAPGHALGLLERAALHERHGELAQASFLYRQASSCERVAAHALHRAGQLERQLGNPQAAISTLKHALHCSTEDDARTHALFVELGDLYAQLGDYGEAAYFYRRATRLDPNREDVQLRLRYAEKLGERPPCAPIDLRNAG
jgi:tetratricopeptide (TPR) repeat protein